MSEKLVRTLEARLDAKLVETHISWLLLAGDLVYKFKKPVDLGFLDFSTLTKRRHACEEEIRLNRRTAPDIYRDVIAISGTEDDPVVDDARAPIEYAVRMNRFDDSRLLDNLARKGDFSTTLATAVAESVAAFHDAIRTGTPPAGYGSVDAVAGPARDNFADIGKLDHVPEDQDTLAALQAWTERAITDLSVMFSARRHEGYVRECHGDLHLGNLYQQGEKVVLFDCIEFNPALRWIDVAADIAFVLMDLMDHDLETHAHLLLNEYLAKTGDYGCLPVLDFYLVYRAMVRAKVSAIRARQDKTHGAALHKQATHYMQLASRITAPREPAMILMCGLSGTGKTTVARTLAQGIGAIHLRSDVERKRLYGLGPNDSSHRHGLDIYSPLANERTFAHLQSLALVAIESRRPVIVDATFIELDLRRRFTHMAERLGVPWTIVECTATQEEVGRRLAARTGDASEAGMAQYIAQREKFEPFDESEKAHVLRVDSSNVPPDLGRQVRQRIQPGTSR
ncbi:MAG: AAA family ATPase [Pseudomonadales bacterium]|nr:AAA family ATPase [Pseudomonadales bacterium]